MKIKIKKLLLPFYFGSVNEEERLFMEREMLSDPEALLEYLDLKRSIEAADPVPSDPSSKIWERIRPTTPYQKKIWISFSLGAALAAVLALFFIRQESLVQEDEPPSLNRTLFDSSAEFPVSSDVL